MLNIVALSPGDGWAVVRQGDDLLLVRPPYRRSNQRPVDDAYVEMVISRCGFRQPDEPMELPGWSALVAYLNHQVEAARAEQGQTLDDQGLSERLLPMAPEPVLRGFLERTRKELPSDPAAWGDAERLLLVLLRLPQVRGSSDMNAETVELLDRLSEAKR